MKRPILAVALVLMMVATACPALQGPNAPRLSTRIIDSPVATQRQARLWARDHGAPAYYRNLVPVFWRVARARGVRPDGAFAQSAKETNFGRFTGVVSARNRNPCGLKITAGGSNDDPNAHARFPNWTTGITACVDHLALYAGARGYPRASSPDPRHFPSIRRTAPTFQRLGGRWAPSRAYGREIVDMLLDMIFNYR